MERKIYFEKYDSFIKYAYTRNDLSIFEYFRYLFIYLFYDGKINGEKNLFRKAR